MSKIYIAVWNDSHAYTTVHPFIDKERAIAEAKAAAMHFAHEESDYKERTYGRNDGWVFYAEYGPEDNIRVVEVEMDKGLFVERE